MPIATTRSTVSFAAPFQLKGWAEAQPAGEYQIETDEEVIESNGRTVYRRVATLMMLSAAGATRTVSVDPHELERALARDRMV